MTSDATQAVQTTEDIGWFKSAGTGSAQVYEWVPLQDAAGNFLALNLGGITTFRTTAETPYNANTFMLVPATLEAPVVANVSPVHKTNTSNIAAGIDFSVLSPGAGVNSDAIHLKLNGADHSGLLTFSGTESAWNVHCGGLVANTNYTVEIQVADKAGIDLGFPYTGTPLSNPRRSFSFGTFSEITDYAVQFNGTNTYVDATSVIQSLPSLGDFTFAGWFNIHTNTALQYLYRFSGAEGNVRRIQLTEANGVLTADVRLTPAGTIYAITSSAFTYDTWVHIAFTRSGPQIILYINGQEAGAGPITETDSTANLWGYLGANTYNSATWGVPANFFKGAIDQFQIWTNALTAQQVQTIMTQAITPASGLIGGWEFNEGAGNVAYDFSGANQASALMGAHLDCRSVGSNDATCSSGQPQRNGPDSELGQPAGAVAIGDRAGRTLGRG